MRPASCALVLSLCAGAAGARDLGFDHFIHSKLEAKDGLSAQAHSIVQTPDGYLWFGTPEGLFRYNGQTFERVQTDRKDGFIDASVIEAIVTRRGEIWLALGQNSGVAIMRGGLLHSGGMRAPPPQITHLVENVDGTIWAASSGREKRLYRFDGKGWQQMDLRLAMPPGAAADLERDRRGTIWLSLTEPGTSISRLAFLRPGTSRFEVAPDKIGLGRLAIDPQGGLWISDNLGTRMLRDPSGQPPRRAIAYPPVQPIGFPRIRFDRSGNIWGSSLSGGMFLIPDAANPANNGTPPKTFREDDRNVVTFDVFPDREGNVWISSTESVHRFHPANAVPVAGIKSDPRLPQRLAAASDSSVYLFSLGSLYRIRPNDQPRLVASGLGPAAVMCPARSGGVWLMFDNRTLLFEDGQQRALPARPVAPAPILCQEDGLGRLWALSRNSVSWFRGGQWTQGFPGLGAVDVWDASTDASGALILSLYASKLVHIDERSVTTLQTGWTGAISSMRNTRLGLLVSHAGGLWRAPGDDRPAANISARALGKRRDFDVADDHVWTFGNNGIERFSATALDKDWGKDSAPAGMLFDWSEGLPLGKQDVAYRGRQLVAGSDGRIWALTRNGPYVIDSHNIIRNTIAPPLAIRGLWVQGRDRNSLGDTHPLPGGTRSVRIEYSALSYSMPERVQFKYRLIGTSDEWTNAGNRHDVTFGNLGPGNYRFEVVGANEDGVWNRKPAVLDFTIAPTFVQSNWFKIGVALLLLAAIGFAYRWRTYILTTRVRNAMAERSAERDRIARELHDTLLQSVQGLILRFQLLVNHLPEQHPSRQELSTTLDQADEVLAESRQRVLDLRARHPRSDLKSVIAALAKRQLPPERVQTDIRTEGEIVPVESSVFNGLIDVANECLFNIVRHAEARHVQVDIRYTAAQLEMDVRDDGVGLDAASISDAAASGHFGIIGMKERVATLGGKFRIDSTPGQGVAVFVRIPASIAYRTENPHTPPRGRGWLWFPRQAPEAVDR